MALFVQDIRWLAIQDLVEISTKTSRTECLKVFKSSTDRRVTCSSYITIDQGFSQYFLTRV